MRTGRSICNLKENQKAAVTVSKIMDDSSLAAHSLSSDELSGSLGKLRKNEETHNPQLNISNETTVRRKVAPSNDSHKGDDSVFSDASAAPQLHHRPRSLFRRNRVQSAPTLMEHKIGLALRHISDEFNDIYLQVEPQPSQRRRASHPNTNDHHVHGMFGLWQQFRRNSRTSSSASSENVVSKNTSWQRSPRITLHESVHSVPEEDEEAVEDLN